MNSFDEEIAARATAGETCKAIAEALGLERSMVQGRLSVLARAGRVPRKTGQLQRALRAALGRPRNRPQMPTEGDALIRAEYAKPDGLQAREIAARLGVTPEEVTHRAGQLKIRRHPGWVGERRLKNGHLVAFRTPRAPRPKGELRQFERLCREDLKHGAPIAGDWPEDAQRFADLDRLDLLRELLWPRFRLLPAAAAHASASGCALRDL